MASGLDQAEPVKLYLYIFRNRAAFDRHLGQIGPCATAFVTDPTTYEQVAQSPYVLVGQGPWAPGFEAAIHRVLEQAAGTGRLIARRPALDSRSIICCVYATRTPDAASPRRHSRPPWRCNWRCRPARCS